MMFTENEKKANELIAKIKNTFSNADKALEYKKARQTEYKNLVNSMKNVRDNTSRALDIMKDNVDEENYIKIKQNQKRAKYDAGPAEALQSLSRMKKNFKASKASTASTPLFILPEKKDRIALNALRDAELMRVNDELLGKVMPAFKPLLIKSSSSMGSAPAMMMKPVDTLKKIKKLRNEVVSTVIPSITNLNPEYPDYIRVKKFRNEVASTVIPSIETPNPNYGSIKKQFFETKGENKNPWLEHVKKCRSENPEYTYKQALQKCKETYTKINIKRQEFRDKAIKKMINMKPINL